MKIIKIKKNTILKIILLFVFTFTVTKITTSFGMQHYYNVEFSTGLVTASTLNVRSGPGTNYPVVTKVYKNQYIRVFAGVGNWYIVQVEGDYIGAVSKQYIKAIYPNGNGTENTNNLQGNTTTTNTSELTADELEVFNLINKQRANNRITCIKN